MENGRKHRFRNIRPFHQMEAKHLPTLPEEIIEEIMFRLPVKSLLKFRCVSKSYRSLISSKKFVKAHLGNSSKNTHFTHHRIILDICGRGGPKSFCSLLSLWNEPFTNSFTVDNPMISPSDSIAGCCDGLVCIMDDEGYFLLWNPSTRMSKKLPAIHWKVKSGCITKYGFGYDQSNDDYKVFAVLSLQSSDRTLKTIVKVYSLKSDSWKRIKHKDDQPFEEEGKFVNGKLHWGGIYGSNSNIMWAITTFDLKSNMYGNLEPPRYDKGNCDPYLWVLDGCLCLLCGYAKTRFDVWVLKEYDVNESWDKVVTVPYLCGSWRAPLLAPLCIGPNREILFFHKGGTFMIYNPENGSFSQPQTLILDGFYVMDVYVESLVSLLSDGEQGANQETIV